MPVQLLFNRICFASMLIFIVLSLCLSQSNPADATQDITGYRTAGASNERHFELPGVCIGTDRSSWWRCTFSPQCEPMKNLNAQQRRNLVAQYNQALFGASIGPLRVPNTATLKPGVVAMIMNYYYAPYTARYVEISIGPTNTSDWANILNQKNSAGKYPLIVSDDLFYLSAAMLMQSLGHEIVHLAQYQRTYSMNVLNINSAITAFRELEASTWESGTVTLNYFAKNGSNFFNCLRDVEKNSSREMVRCRQWDVKRAIQDVREKEQLRRGPMNTLEKWLGEDEWTKTYWLPNNPDWKTYNPGPKPENCPI